eukprot:9071184-Pyramimonas_sp.AAC.1
MSQWRSPHGIPAPFRRTIRTFRGPFRQLQLRSQWRTPHGIPAPMWRTVHTLRGHTGSSN